MQNTRNLERIIEACLSERHCGRTLSDEIEHRIERDVLALEVEDFDDLEIKARIILRLVANKRRSSAFSNPHNDMLKQVLQDIMAAYANEKSKFDGSYGQEAPDRYFSLFYPNYDSKDT